MTEPKRSRSRSRSSALAGISLESTAAEDSENTQKDILSLPIESIEVTDQQRDKENALEDEGLSESIGDQGLLQNIVVIPHPELGNQYILVAGERRYHNAKKAGLQFIPAKVVNLDAVGVVSTQYHENARRKALTVAEEIKAVKNAEKAITETGSNQSVMDILGENPNWVSIRRKIGSAKAPWLMDLARIETDTRKLYELGLLFEQDESLATNVYQKLKNNEPVSRNTIVEYRKNKGPGNTVSQSLIDTLEGTNQAPSNSDDSSVATTETVENDSNQERSSSKGESKDKSLFAGSDQSSADTGSMSNTAGSTDTDVLQKSGPKVVSKSKILGVTMDIQLNGENYQIHIPDDCLTDETVKVQTPEGSKSVLWTDIEILKVVFS